MVVGGSNGVFQRRLEIRVGKCSVDPRWKTFEHGLTREREKGRCEFHRVASFRRSDHQKATLSSGGGSVVR
ncbi:hypothetical protein V6N13_018369 [Hibiscus sabdariffa]